MNPVLGECFNHSSYCALFGRGECRPQVHDSLQSFRISVSPVVSLGWFAPVFTGLLSRFESYLWSHFITGWCPPASSPR